uniref:G-protein coupled receptors family 1 profile domain-containing protein n=1 Tax=Poecilia mexicana TaxID=48701 RepID=A0A3B3WLS9_9TELE
MLNSTQVPFFTLAAYFDTKQFKYLLFMFVLSLYVLIIGSNVLLIAVICVNRSLHEPMFLFLCSLFVNELFGSLGLFPFLLVQILSDVHIISAPLCFLQIFCLYTYAGIEFFNLAIMSYDRYLAICHPLNYHSLMTLKKVAVFIAAAWIAAFLVLCGNFINKVYCDNYSLVKLACSNTTVNNIYGLAAAALIIFVPLVLILYTYLRILQVCFSGSKQTRQKAISTCTPHLASLLNYSLGVCFELLQSRFNMDHVPNYVRIFLSLYFLTCQPLFNPVMYGLNLSKIRNVQKSLFSIKRR